MTTARQFFRSLFNSSVENPDLNKTKDMQTFYTDCSTAYNNRDRSEPELRAIIEESLRMWRNNPLARRIVTLTTQYVVGRGITFKAEHEREDKLLHEFWNHPLNHMDARISEWSDEICRTGNLFILISSDEAGMSFVRAVPAAQIEEIIPRENDIEQPVQFRTIEPGAFKAAKFTDYNSYPAASRLMPTTAPAMIHFAVNRPVAAQWGEPDLAPLLFWLKQYDDWLKNRCLLNKYRTSFLYVIRKKGFSNSVENGYRQQRLNTQPPTPGSIFIVPDDEEWSVINPQLESAEANEDGLSIKKMIAAGAGIPIQFLSETGTSTKSDSGTANGAGCRNFEQRQEFILWLIRCVLEQVLSRAALMRSAIDPETPITVTGDAIRPVFMNDVAEEDITDEEHPTEGWTL